ncbi:MAG: c-type cytochrome [Geminicoccaceae bacterium]
MSRVGRPIVLPVACLLLAGAGAAHAAGDAEQGATVFKKCQACHAVEEEENKIGPHLVGIFGREAGSIEDFRYSGAMKDSGIVWQDDTITAYLKAPKSYLPGTKMLFAGMKDDEIADLLAYLHAETGS